LSRGWRGWNTNFSTSSGLKWITGACAPSIQTTAWWCYVGPAPAVGGEAKVPAGCAAPKASASPRTTIWIFLSGPKIAIVLNYLIEYKVICIVILLSTIKMRNEKALEIPHIVPDNHQDNRVCYQSQC